MMRPFRKYPLQRHAFLSMFPSIVPCRQPTWKRMESVRYYGRPNALCLCTFAQSTRNTMLKDQSKVKSRSYILYIQSETDGRVCVSACIYMCARLSSYCVFQLLNFYRLWLYCQRHTQSRLFQYINHTNNSVNTPLFTSRFVRSLYIHVLPIRRHSVTMWELRSLQPKN